VELSDSQIDAICILLEDNQARISGVLDRQIASMSNEDQERLFDRLVEAPPRRISLPRALEDFHHRRLERDFSDWSVSRSGEPNLEEGIFLLASFGSPLEDMSHCLAELNQMAEEVKNRIGGLEGASEIVRRATHYIHEELEFDGNREAYYDVENSYFNRVLDRRLGIPITLSALYILIGRRSGLPFRGIGMPGHFIVKYDYPDAPIYLDPFAGGQIVTISQCEEIVRGMGYHFDIRFLKETPDARIIERMINNLIGIYHREGDEKRSRQLVRYREIIQRA
jgi:regulator of sirC expression with transglutaminase-like and TPR domain